jgi:hypothetical protein
MRAYDFKNILSMIRMLELWCALRTLTLMKKIIFIRHKAETRDCNSCIPKSHVTLQKSKRDFPYGPSQSSADAIL